MADWQAVFGVEAAAFGKAVRERREQVGLTQEKLAEEADIDLTYVGGIERGKRNPSFFVILRIARSLGTTPAALIGDIR